MENRRYHQRYALEEYPVYCEMNDSRGYYYYARIRDISSRGARLDFPGGIMPDRMAIGEEVSISGYSAGGGYLPPRISAKPVWHDRSAYGFEFAGSAFDADEDVLAAYPYARSI